MLAKMKHGYTIGFDAHYANTNNTDLGNYSRSIIDALAAASPRHCYVRMYVRKRHPNAAYDALDHRANIESMEPDGTFWRKFTWLWRNFRLAKDAERGDVALFHGLAGELPLGLARHKIRSVVTLHDLEFIHLTSFYNPLQRALFRLHRAYMLHLADRIVAVSDCVKRDAVKYLHIDPEKIDVIYRSCGKEFHTPLSNEQLAVVRERYALPERYMLTVGTQSERKNISLIIEAMAEVQDKELQLVIVGRCTGNTEQIRHRIKSLGLEDRVTFLYGVPSADLPAIYACAEMFLNVSIYEGFAQSIVEAITMGVPVIASSGSSHEEAGGEGSIYVSPKDRVELKEAIERLAASSELRAEMAQKGRDYSTHFRSEVIAYNIINCYRRIGIDLNE